MWSALRLGTLFAAAVTLFGAPAGADPIALTGGLLDLDVASGGDTAGLVQLTGDRGFTLTGSMVGIFLPPVGNPLVPGTTVTLQTSASQVGGTATLDGVTYTDLSGLDSPAGATLRFVSTATLPSVLSPPSSIVAPFSVELLFFLQNQADPISLLGSGTATIFLDEDRGFGVPSWRVTGIRGEVSSAAPAPVPEPATLLLLGGGLGWVALRRRRS